MGCQSSTDSAKSEICKQEKPLEIYLQSDLKSIANEPEELSKFTAPKATIDLAREGTSLSAYSEDIIKVLSHNSPFIRELKLGFKIQNYDVEALQQISAKISEAPTLQSLELEMFVPYDFSKFKQLFETLKGLPKVLSSLEFESTELQEGSLADFVIFSTAQTQLKTLKFKAAAAAVVDSEFRTICDAIKKFQFLEKLVIDVRSCWELSDRSLQYQSSLLQELSSLKHLTLDFGTCKEITNSGLNALANGFKGLVNLESIDLNFSISDVENQTKITTQGVQFITGGLGLLQNLKSISLDFSGQQGIDDGSLADSGVKTMVEKQKERLTHLKIWVNFCNKISSKGFEMVLKGLEFAKRVQVLDLGFKRCAGTNDRLLQQIIDTTKNFENFKEMNLIMTECNNLSAEQKKKVENNYTEPASFIYF